MADRPHQTLMAWQEALELVVQTYALVRYLPKDEKFGLTSQMKRAAVSITSNIAEGAARSSNAEKLHFYHMSRGSLSELESQILIGLRLGFFSPEHVQGIRRLASRVSALLQGLIEFRRRKLLAAKLS